MRGIHTALLVMAQGLRTIGAPAATAAETADTAAALTASASGGDASAQYTLGIRYADGRDVPTDCGEAAKWLRLAAAQMHPAANFRLGVLHAEGCGVPRDDSEAIRLYRYGAEVMDADAQQALGYMHYAGRGVARSEADAVRWFRRARDQRFGLDARWIAPAYDSSTRGGRPGVPKDDVLAYFWYTLATSANERATPRSLRDQVATRLRPEQLTQAERLLDEWRKTLDRNLEDWIYLLAAYAASDESEKRLKAAGADAVPALLAVLDTAVSPPLVRQITRLLSEIEAPTDSIAPALARMLASRPPTQERIFIAIALASVAMDDAAAARPDLERGVREGGRDTSWRSDCVWALARIGAPESAPVLVEVLGDEEPFLRATAAWGLRRGPAAVVRAPLEKALLDPAIRVRVQAASSLFELLPEPPPAALTALIDGVCKGDDRDAGLAAGALDGRSDLLGAAEKDLDAYLQSPDAACRGRAAVALVVTKPDRARELIEPLRHALSSDNGYLRLVAAQTLAGLGRAAREALPDLEKAASADPGLQNALARMKAPPTRFDECRGDDLRLVAVVPAQDGHRGFVLCEGRQLWQVAPGTRFLDGRVEGVGPEAMELAMDAPASPARRLDLFEGGEPETWTPDPRFTGAPLNIAFEGDVSALVRLLGTAFGRNVILEAGTEGRVRVAARDAPWDAAVHRALNTAGLDYRLDRGLLRVAKSDRMGALRALSPREPTEAPISLDFSHGDIRDVARLFQDILGVDITLPAEASERLTIFVMDRPADEVFDWIVASRGWTSRQEGTRIVVEAPRPGRP